MKWPLINILTRTGKREVLYHHLRNSIEEQTYPFVRHLKSNDNPECNYLRHETDVFAVDESKEAEREDSRFYNLYLNTLASYITEGWVIILDDDSKMIDSSFLSQLADICDVSRENEIIIYRARIGEGEGVIPPIEHMNEHIIEKTCIDMACFCAHYTVFAKYKFTSEIYGDYNFLTLLKNSNEFQFKFVENLPVGIHANYEGARHGT
jgi:hypothetical protein